MNILNEKETKLIIGGAYWSCKHAHHKSWANSTFISTKGLGKNTAKAHAYDHEILKSHQGCTNLH